jgi:hypothetical protein
MHSVGTQNRKLSRLSGWPTRTPEPNSGLPGRPKGARNKFAEAFFADLYEDWKQHGIQAIREVRESRPAEYFRICAIIVRGASDFNSLADGLHNEAIEELIEERRRQALLMIEKMKT